MGELDDKLKDYYEFIRSQDTEIAPAFEELTGKVRRKSTKRKLPVYLKVAAVLVFAILMTWHYSLDSSKDKELIVTNVITKSLMQEPEFIWDWNPPTQSLMNTIEF